MKYSVPARESLTIRKPAWPAISVRFSDDRECLAAFLAFETAEILEGVKPASLVNLVNRERNCGKNFYTLWKELGEEILSDSSLCGWVLADRGDSLLLMLYQRCNLERILANRGVVSLLRKAGYQAPFTEVSVLGELQRRIYTGRFPHEIGTLLGYPVKDVAGFLGWSKLPCTGTAPWKMFGDPSASLALAEAFRRSRKTMADRLLADTKPYECLRCCKEGAEAKIEKSFSAACNDNEYQYNLEAF